MSDTVTVRDEVGAYADAVLRELADLPEAERADLVDDLEQHLAEVAAEGEGSLAAQLGAPETYAAELRASAGLSAFAAPHHSWRAQLRASAEQAGVRLRSLPGAAAVLDFLPELRPAWWLVRGPLLVLLVVVIQGLGLGVSLLVPMAAAAAASVALGRRGVRGHLRAAVTVANVIAGWFGLWLLLMLLGGGLGSAAAAEGYAPMPVPVTSPFLTHPEGEPITNLYVYDANGRQLEDVYVYDGGGRPVEVGPIDAAVIPELETDYERAADGTPLTNRYPLDQYLRSFDEADGSVVRRPRPAPEVTIPGADDGSDDRVAPSPAPRASVAPTPATSGVR